MSNPPIPQQKPPVPETFNGGGSGAGSALGLLSGGLFGATGMPGFSGGDAGPAISGTGPQNIHTAFSAPFTVAGKNASSGTNTTAMLVVAGVAGFLLWGSFKK